MLVKQKAAYSPQPQNLLKKGLTKRRAFSPAVHSNLLKKV